MTFEPGDFVEAEVGVDVIVRRSKGAGPKVVDTRLRLMAVTKLNGKSDPTVSHLLVLHVRAALTAVLTKESCQPNSKQLGDFNGSELMYNLNDSRCVVCPGC